MSAAARILDANANRAREALRVMEDAARFALDDEALAASLKALRHDLARSLARLPEGWLIASRDATGDVGRGRDARGHVRGGLADVAWAAGMRLGEAMRVLEETARTLDPELAEALEALRYRGYELEQALALRLGSARRRQWRVCLLLTEARCRRPWREVAAGAIAGGCDCIQVREPAMPDRALARRVEEVLALARPAGVSVVVNDRPDVALVAGADGVHLGQRDLTVAQVRRLAGRSLLVGVSTHDIGEGAAAVEAGADYVGLGSMFETATKDGPRLAGPAYLVAFLERYPEALHLAVGGIGPENVGRVVEAGARGVAVCSAVCGAERPEDAVRALRRALEPRGAGMAGESARGAGPSRR